MFPALGKFMGAPTLLGLLERDNLNQWTWTSDDGQSPKT
jgi:hypothetical protein